MTIYLAITLTIMVVMFVFFNIRTKQMVYKYHRLNKKIEDKFIEYISKIENRISKPFTEFSIDDAADDWACIISFNRSELVLQTIETAKKFEPTIKIIVIDNGSSAETIHTLVDAKIQGKIDKLVLNSHSDIKQWQKCFSIASAMKLLSLKPVKSITFIDDDILIEGAWLEFSNKLVNEIPHVKMVSLMNDHIQENIHKTIEEVTIDNEVIKLKQSFIGTFFYFPIQSISDLGMPPFNEGISEASVEDWYYSRLITAKDWKIATINRCTHLGYSQSIREEIEKQLKK